MPIAPHAGQALVSAGMQKSRERRARGEDHYPPSLLDHLLHDEQMEEHDIIRHLTDLFLAAADTVGTFLFCFPS